MNDLSNYRQIVEYYFGKGMASFPQIGTSTNNVIGALNRAPGEFDKFRAAFTERLQRLSTVYQPRSKNWTTLIDQINLIADKSNWEGAYSELAAYDYFCHCRRFAASTFTPIDLNVNLLNTDTFSSKLGGKGPANLDGHFSWCDVYTDVKSLKDIVEELLHTVAEEASAKQGISNLVVVPQYPAGVDYLEIRNKRTLLVNELQQNLDVSKQPPLVESKVVPGLSYRLGWKRGATIGERELNPYKAAEKYHRLVFGYAKKFTLSKPFLLVLVSFDWFYGAPTKFACYDTDFYRAFTRRVFLQYLSSPQPFSEFNQHFTGLETVHDVTKKISGILFLRDRCISSTTPKIANVEGYLYLNPEADNSLMNTLFYQYLLEHELQRCDAFIGDVY